MKDPTRWIDDPSSAPRGAASLLAQARRAPSPGAAARARMGARIAASTGGVAKFAGLGVRWWIVGGTVGLATALIGFVGARRISHDSVSRVAHVAPVVPARASNVVTEAAPVHPAVVQAVAPLVSESITPPPVAPPVEHRSGHVVASNAAPDAASAEREEALLERARAALQSENPGQALALVREHATQFAHPTLREERESIAVRALARLGRTSEALARGNAFLRRYPSGLYTASVQRVMEQLR